MSVPNIKLNNGFLIPNIGIGTWQVNYSSSFYVFFEFVCYFEIIKSNNLFFFQAREGEVKQAVKDAIDLGYRHIDTAFLYSNEKEKPYDFSTE